MLSESVRRKLWLVMVCKRVIFNGARQEAKNSGQGEMIGRGKTVGRERLGARRKCKQ